jgi:hypothetical protein
MMTCSVQYLVGGYVEPFVSKIIAQCRKTVVPQWQNGRSFNDSVAATAVGYVQVLLGPLKLPHSHWTGASSRLPADYFGSRKRHKCKVYIEVCSTYNNGYIFNTQNSFLDHQQEVKLVNS